MHILLPSLFFLKNSFDKSFNGRNPCLSDPKFTNAASRLDSILETVALNILPFNRVLSLSSVSKSYNFAPSTKATLNSFPYDEFINILFIFFPNMGKTSVSMLKL